ncbi:MAG: hypothetical protein ACRBN8_22055 [Nannocystales bacterium]
MSRVGNTGRALLGLAFATGCPVPELDLEGRPCPCLGGWQCDAETQTCIREASEASGVAESTSSPGTGTTASTTGTTQVGAESSTGTPPQSAFEVVSFSADWSTPQSMHWTWELEGDEEDFRAYELWIATSAEALEAGDAIVFDRDLNPELGRYSLANTDGVDLVVGTISDGLQAGTEYYGQLHVLDTAGGRSVSSNVAVRSTTAEPTSSLSLFADDTPFPPGFPLPECLGRTDMAPSEGTHHFELLMECLPDGMPACEPVAEPGPECFENLRLQDLGLGPVDIGGGDFAEAFLELDIAIVPPDDSPAHGWWSDLSLQGSEGWPGLRGVTLRADGEYRRYQIPLTQIWATHEEFDGVIQGVRVGSQWRRGAVIRIDQISVRW